jgi:hypothetical protein
MGMIEFEIERLPEFNKDLKKLLKRFPTIEEDLNLLLKTQIPLTHEHRIDNRGTFPLEGIGIEGKMFFKIKKFPCRSLKGKGARSGLRVIYTHYDENKIDLIEIYYKQNKENEDRSRIMKNYRTRQGGKI